MHTILQLYNPTRIYLHRKETYTAQAVDCFYSMGIFLIILTVDSVSTLILFIKQIRINRAYSNEWSTF